MAETKIEKKKVDIYSLYKKEKTIRIEDDSDNYVDILLVKLTQGQRAEILKEYYAYLEDHKLELQAREDKTHVLAFAIEQYSKEELINNIVTYEKSQRGDIADLYPAFDGKSEEEKQKLIVEELIKFTETRKVALDKSSVDELRKIVIGLSIESQAILDSVRILNYQSLVFMCLDPETRNQIFKSIADVDKLIDKSVIEKLIDEMIMFRINETPKQVRKIASEDQTFLAVGESQKSSVDSPVTTS